MSAAVVASSILMATPALVDAGLKIFKFYQASQTEPEPSRPSREGSKTRTSSTLPAFTSSQRRAMLIIAQEVYRHPLSPTLARSRPALILGLWINAWFESRLNPDAYNGKGESSVGLFQINQRAHPGHATQDLQDPAYNTRTFLGLIRAQASQYDNLLRQGASIHTLAAAITLWTERPKDKEKKAVLRAEELVRWFPDAKKYQALEWKP